MPGTNKSFKPVSPFAMDRDSRVSRMDQSQMTGGHGVEKYGHVDLNIDKLKPDGNKPYQPAPDEGDKMLANANSAQTQQARANFAENYNKPAASQRALSAKKQYNLSDNLVDWIDTPAGMHALERAEFEMTARGTGGKSPAQFVQERMYELFRDNQVQVQELDKKQQRQFDNGSNWARNFGARKNK